VESKKTTRLHPRNKCDTIYRRYYIYIYMCSKRKIQQEKENRREMGSMTRNEQEEEEKKTS
jgi:hypothetical protein